MTTQLKPIIERPALTEGQAHSHPIINRVLQNRGISSPEEMEYSLKDLINPFLMKGMQGAVEMIHRHLLKQSKVVIVGDFDCDGATSTSIAVEGLKMMGFEHVDYIIPDRVIHGYGLTPSIVKLAEEMEPDLIITVDNGIASFDGALAVKAMSRPCELLVTDHHLPAESGYPDADCIVNPSQAGCEFPSKCIAGCGVMFYVILGLRTHLRNMGYFEEKGIEQPVMSGLLDLVALGTIADLVPLDKNNRILVDAGIKRIRSGRARPGIKAILEVAKKDPSKVVAADFGFGVGPRINAAGRLEGMEQGIECLLSTSEAEAVMYAARLDELNLQRRDIEADHVIDAAEIIEQHNLKERMGVVIHDPTWHPGVVGIVSSRIKEKLNRPIICMTDTAEAEEARNEVIALQQGNAPQSEIDQALKKLAECDVKGSARSIPGVHMKHVLDNISKKHPEVLYKFGGHAMAAGLSVKSKYLQTFMDLFDAEVSALVTEEMILGSVDVDIKDVPSEGMDIDLARELRDLGPWGQAFPEPLFHGKFKVINSKILKEKHLKMTVAFSDSPGKQYSTISFNCVENGELPIGDTFEASFQLDINEYPPGKENLQLMMRELQDKPFELVLENKPVEKKEPAVRQRKDPVAGPRANETLEGMKDAEAKNIRTRGAAAKPEASPVMGFREELQSIVNQMKEKKAKAMEKTSDGMAP